MIRHTANPPARGASAPAAKAAPSSCLTPTQLMSFRVGIESVLPLSEFRGLHTPSRRRHQLERLPATRPTVFLTIFHPSVNKYYVLSECGSDNFPTATRDEGRRRPPFSTASTLSRASMPIAVRVSIVALPICGNRNVFFSETYSG
jgi:hypothetical protein